MKKTAKYVKKHVNGKTLILSDKEFEHTNLFYFRYFKDFEYSIHDNMLFVQTKEIQFDHTGVFGKTWITPDNEKSLDASKECIFYGYKTLLDVLKGNKRPYINGWYKKKTLKNVSFQMNGDWVIEYV